MSISRLGVPTTSEEEDLCEDNTKIFYCSRTHSQLTQFVNEIRRVKLPSAQSENLEKPTARNVQDAEVVKHLPLGSRKNLCINSSVARLGSAPAINERCLDLQQPSTPADRKCPFLPKKENQALVNEFRDHTLAKIRDIEDLGSLGKKIGICPYYSVRASIKPSEVLIVNS